MLNNCNVTFDIVSSSERENKCSFILGIATDKHIWRTSLDVIIAVELDCIVSFSLPSFLLKLLLNMLHFSVFKMF